MPERKRNHQVCFGQEEKVRNEISAIRLANDKVMEQLSDFLRNPKFDVKELS